MLLLVTGASGVGKSTALAAVASADFGQRVECVEFDSVGVPDGADTAWRHGATEQWVQYALERQREGTNVVLFGQVAPGEMLAAPSVDQVDALAICVLHASPETQEARLLGRGESGESLFHHLRFGAWLGQHSRDPQYAPEVIRVESPTSMKWERWANLRAGDSAWPVHLIDTDGMPRDEVARAVEAWIAERL